MGQGLCCLGGGVYKGKLDVCKAPSFVCSFGKHVLDTYCVPNTLSEATVAAVSKHLSPGRQAAHSLAGETHHQHKFPYNLSTLLWT